MFGSKEPSLFERRAVLNVMAGSLYSCIRVQQHCTTRRTWIAVGYVATVLEEVDKLQITLKGMTNVLTCLDVVDTPLSLTFRSNAMEVVQASSNFDRHSSTILSEKEVVAVSLWWDKNQDGRNHIQKLLRKKWQILRKGLPRRARKRTVPTRK